MPASVAIILQETLVKIGLRHILNELFNINPLCITTFENDKLENFDLYITDANIYIEHLDYFIPRKNKTIIITSNNSINAKGLILNKYADEEEIIEMFRVILKDIENQNSYTHGELSQREIEVLKLIASGLINKEIADRLNISINTVLSHRKNITAKLGIRSVSGLSFYAMMNGYIVI